MSTADPIVRVSHIRAAHMCTSGARRWFLHRALNWSLFLSEGLPASIIGQWGDPLAERAIVEARRDAADVE